MKPTDKERRDVAENLRNMCGYGCRYAEQFYELLKETVMNSWDFHEFGDVAERLADLIEPAPERTCMPIMPPYEPGVEEVPVCSECGRQMFLEDDDAYCPRCGAKVIEEES